MLRLFSQISLQNSKRFYSTPAYSVSRTTNKGLPVYSEYKNGGTRLLTIIRKIQGDSNALAKDITTDFPEAVVQVNATTQHVVIKGHHVNEIKEWLINKGF
ncbi:mitochondrial large subunit ribosomal protein-domain-containing protein [Gilbertella persicaria]|uniref:mitochondrial large subunit ribosomal protein-domain-containing protein n=1 Tax=Gilbertella persicaria TaxID=101096 RepID=UPI00221F175D|nr:mitochondrial large subunit ribosomal protein-domain-containing protein [Gilbertella persicaria]KAI8081925.1 mitochondrial large subunit ribosomal protein-domain-containing protein [Gilbertella persicaria]